MRVLGSDSFDAYLKTYDIPFETDMEALLHSSVACAGTHFNADISFQLSKTALGTFC